MICREMIGWETDWKALEPEIRGASVEEIDTFFYVYRRIMPGNEGFKNVGQAG